ncbi:transglycosylase domain-containing protein [Isoptericola variabilis]|uniref:Peptidoglycan glycosyltransferase n=1 Tax=Isoptericola variabilis (strain 225) TaxID=743718 RepID=F6FUH6_ISOV2|nr:transglycosylase domain-containing protein [Isoptericola variabilis]AEG45403.1 Peptidoglycan glycosyltransferase [Isoptericola variabilis 225]TWH30253.1 membrane peptidoglycan carboxypeptidase [Isoptericola variabilis J7]
MANPESRRITRTMSATQLVALLLAFLLAAGAGGVLASGLVVPLVAAANVAANSTVQIFDEVPDELEPGPLSQQSRIYASDGTLLATFYAQNRIVVSLDEVSEHMKNAVVAIEDERFWEHGGVDVRGITRALANNLGGNSTQGASTLTQQYVKNVLIEQAVVADDPFGVLEAREDSMSRKLREAKLAIALEKRMSKEEILQGYLNVAQFGSRNIYGVETASQYYFSKSSKDLTPVEAATIAGVTKAPSAFDPTVDPAKAQERRDAVLYKMWQQGYLSTAEYDEARNTPLEETLKVKPVEVGCHGAKGAAFFCDYVTKEIVLSPAFGETRADREALLYRGGLDIHTTLDMTMQAAAEKSITEAVPAEDPSHLEAAIVSVEPGTGQIKAMAQNVPFTDPQDPEAGRQTTMNYSADFLHGASRGLQPGSNFKPIVLAQWLKEGHTLLETVNANRVERVVGNFNTPCLPRGLGRDTWAPRNAEGFLTGNISVLRATYESVNTAYASMGYQLDLCALRDTAWDMGFRPTSSSVPPRVLTAPERTDIDVLAPMVIGTQETTPLSMASVYATLASGGTYCDPVAITSVTGPDGTEYDVPDANCNPDALPENIANTVTYAMERVFTDGTARRAGGLADGRPVAGKTGTSQLSAQTWFTGFTPNLATSVWVGSIESATEDHTDGITVNGQFFRVLYGSSVAVPAWKSFMDVAVQGLPVQGFGPPDPALIGNPPAPSRPAPPPSRPAAPAPPANPAPPAAPNDGGDQGGGGGDGGGDQGPGNGGGNGGGGDGDGGDGGDD